MPLCPLTQIIRVSLPSLLLSSLPLFQSLVGLVPGPAFSQLRSLTCVHLPRSFSGLGYPLSFPSWCVALIPRYSGPASTSAWKPPDVWPCSFADYHWPIRVARGPPEFLQLSSYLEFPYCLGWLSPRLGPPPFRYGPWSGQSPRWSFSLHFPPWMPVWWVMENCVIPAGICRSPAV